jgi:hypothetical protein
MAAMRQISRCISVSSRCADQNRAVIHCVTSSKKFFSLFAYHCRQLMDNLATDVPGAADDKDTIHRGPSCRAESTRSFGALLTQAPPRARWESPVVRRER